MHRLRELVFDTRNTHHKIPDRWFGKLEKSWWSIKNYRWRL